MFLFVLNYLLIYGIRIKIIKEVLMCITKCVVSLSIFIYASHHIVPQSAKFYDREYFFLTEFYDIKMKFMYFLLKGRIIFIVF